MPLSAQTDPRLLANATGRFVVPGTVPLAYLPEAVQSAIARTVEFPPRPVVSLEVMNIAQATMLSPDLFLPHP